MAGCEEKGASVNPLRFNDRRLPWPSRLVPVPTSAKRRLEPVLSLTLNQSSHATHSA
jgi:hypothetical protein